MTTLTHAEIVQQLKGEASHLTAAQLKTLAFVAWTMRALPWRVGRLFLKAWGWFWTTF